MKKIVCLSSVLCFLLSFSLVNAQWKTDYVAATDAQESRPNIDTYESIVHIVYQIGQEIAKKILNCYKPTTDGRVLKLPILGGLCNHYLRLET